jgi:hypothetical protein
MVISLRASLVAFGLMLAPMAASAQQTVIVNAPPPPPRAEMTPPSPGPGFVWVAGFWSWNGTRHDWTSGHWERPPQPAQAWEAPRWESEGGRYRFRPGRWGGGGGMQQPMAVPTPPPVVAVPTAPPPVMMIPQAPPPMRRERQPRIVPPGQVWVAGRWEWNNNQYVWNAGHFEAPPRPRARWMAPRIVRHGRGWQMTPGGWR